MPGTTNHLGLTQHVMAAVPRHPYFRMLIESLDSYNYNWLLPYLTIMNSAGPHFVSMVWSTYLSETERPDVRILAQEEYAGNDWSFFTKEAGGTWHHWDTQRYSNGLGITSFSSLSVALSAWAQRVPAYGGCYTF